MAYLYRRFHPLKAGRRPPSPPKHTNKPYQFPSPQGGSETPLSRVAWVWLKSVSIPSRRVGDLDDGGQYALFAAVSIPSRRVGD